MHKRFFAVNQPIKNIITNCRVLFQSFIQIFKVQAITQWIKDKWYLLIKENDNPHAVAMGLSIGIFGGIVPILGLQTLLIILLLWVCRRPNYAAAMLSSFVMNQFTIIPILYLDYMVGIFFVPPKQVLDFISIKKLIADKDITQLIYVGKGIFYPMLLGGVICGILFSLLTYFITFYLLKFRKEHYNRS
jgi:hypothetical protein